VGARDAVAELHDERESDGIDKGDIRMRRLNTTLITCLAFFFAFSALVQAQGLPSSFDWRDHNGVTPVKNQSSCGSCWAFAAVGTMESAIRIKEGSTTNLSEQHLVSCNTHGWDCGGGWISFPYYLDRQDANGKIGTVMESCFAYRASDVACTCGSCDRVHELLDWGYVAGGGIPTNQQMKEAIYNYGPIFAALSTHSWCLLSPSSGQPSSAWPSKCNGSASQCNHAIVIVGWDDDFKGSGNGCWIIKNSWGTGFWHNGYGYVKYGSGLIGTAASWVDYYGTGGLDCANAIGLTPYVPYDGTTVGGVSRVNTYSCDQWDYSGPEKVHSITTTSVGDLAATLSNHADSLDVLILSDCDPETCIDYAYGPGSITAAYPDAPAGTYSIVVDGYDAASGAYTLTVATGLDCQNAVPLTPGVAYDGSTDGGSSIVHSYTGSGTYDNKTGPEKVHRITAFSSGGDVTATLSDGHASGLEVLIVKPCDPNSCLAHASGTGAITATYPNASIGTYFIVVDGHNGASGSYTLTGNALGGLGESMPWRDLLVGY